MIFAITATLLFSSESPGVRKESDKRQDDEHTVALGRNSLHFFSAASQPQLPNSQHTCTLGLGPLTNQ